MNPCCIFFKYLEIMTYVELDSVLKPNIGAHL